MASLVYQRENCAGDSRQGGLCGARKARKASPKEGRGRNPRGLTTSWYQGGRHYPLGGGVGRVTESDFLISESAYFLCRTALARHALQA